jgi:hypothetical protein
MMRVPPVQLCSVYSCACALVCSDVDAPVCAACRSSSALLAPRVFGLISAHKVHEGSHCCPCMRAWTRAVHHVHGRELML